MERDRADVREARRKWIEARQKRMRRQPGRLVFVDETAVATKMVRLRGRSRRGTRLPGAAPFGHWVTQTFIAGLRCGELIAPWIVDKAMDLTAFDLWVETQLAARPWSTRGLMAWQALIDVQTLDNETPLVLGDLTVFEVSFNKLDKQDPHYVERLLFEDALGKREAFVPKPDFANAGLRGVEAYRKPQLNFVEHEPAKEAIEYYLNIEPPILDLFDQDSATAQFDAETNSRQIQEGMLALSEGKPTVFSDDGPDLEAMFDVRPNRHGSGRILLLQQYLLSSVGVMAKVNRINSPGVSVSFALPGAGRELIARLMNIAASDAASEVFKSLGLTKLRLHGRNIPIRRTTGGDSAPLP